MLIYAVILLIFVFAFLWFISDSLSGAVKLKELEKLQEQASRKNQEEPISKVVERCLLNETERIELIKTVGDTWFIKLQPYGMYWHRGLNKFVIYTDLADFKKGCVFSECEAYKVYKLDLLELNNRTVKTERCIYKIGH